MPPAPSSGWVLGNCCRDGSDDGGGLVPPAGHSWWPDAPQGSSRDRRGDRVPDGPDTVIEITPIMIEIVTAISRDGSVATVADIALTRPSRLHGLRARCSPPRTQPALYKETGPLSRGRHDPDDDGRLSCCRPIIVAQKAAATCAKWSRHRRQDDADRGGDGHRSTMIGRHDPSDHGHAHHGQDGHGGLPLAPTLATLIKSPAGRHSVPAQNIEAKNMDFAKYDLRYLEYTQRP